MILKDKVKEILAAELDVDVKDLPAALVDKAINTRISEIGSELTRKAMKDAVETPVSENAVLAEATVKAGDAQIARAARMSAKAKL